MTLHWRKCPVCNGLGELTTMKSRIQILKKALWENLELKPILPDENNECPICKGKGQLYAKTLSFNPFR
jgi:hypothetical protein